MFSGFKSPTRKLSHMGSDVKDCCGCYLGSALTFRSPENNPQYFTGAAGEGNTELHKVPIVGRDIRDDQPESETELQLALIAMIPTPGGFHDEGGLLVRDLLAEFLRGFSLRTLIFLLDMVLPQLDAYHAGRQLQHLQPWVSVEPVQQQKRGQRERSFKLPTNMRRMLASMSSTYIQKAPASVVLCTV